MGYYKNVLKEINKIICFAWCFLEPCTKDSASEYESLSKDHFLY